VRWERWLRLDFVIALHREDRFEGVSGDSDLAGADSLDVIRVKQSARDDVDGIRFEWTAV
jgi:hypothetical protein